MSPFAEVIDRTAVELSAPHLRAWAAVLRGFPGPRSGVVVALLESRPAPGLGSIAGALAEAWSRHAADLPGEAIALALEVAGLAHERRRVERSQVVVSGPTSSTVPVRLTSAVAAGVIRQATDRILVVSFVAYGVREVVRELSAALDRGVQVDLVLESPAEPGAWGAQNAFRELRRRARFWSWPPECRPVSGGSRASLHAKLIAADERIALLSSANLTDRALAQNLEAGVILRDPGVVAQLVRHFASLMSSTGPLRVASR